MSLIIKEVNNIIRDCELRKERMIREAERICEERRAYEQIKELMGVMYEENDTVRQDT
jgi:hypothetical protein